MMSVRLTIVYPNAAAGFFDFTYYCETHLPRAAAWLGPHGLRAYTVQQGLGTVQGDPPPHRCITHLDFATIEGMRAGFSEHGAALRADFSHYTNIAPVATVCAVGASERVTPDA
jgi:uncharacterized protein (TIGR02118 family)